MTVTEPVYKYVKGEGWVPKVNPTPHGEVSPSGRYVIMFKVPGMHGWRNAKQYGEWVTYDQAQIQYPRYINSYYKTEIKERGWVFEVWPLEEEIDE